MSIPDNLKYKTEEEFTEKFVETLLVRLGFK